MNQQIACSSFRAYFPFGVHSQSIFHQTKRFSLFIPNCHSFRSISTANQSKFQTTTTTTTLRPSLSYPLKSISNPVTQPLTIRCFSNTPYLFDPKNVDDITKKSSETDSKSEKPEGDADKKEEAKVETKDLEKKEEEKDKSLSTEKSFAIKAWEWTQALPAKIKHELLHYWSGTKLLFFEIRITINIIKGILEGNTLTRRERKQLLRTTTDLLRVIPFAFFVIVPFMEFLLPVALKLFPNMLPSTFEDKHKKEEALKKKLKARIELAKFLQETAEQLATKEKKEILDQEHGVNFGDFMKRIKEGETVTNDEILRFAKVFEDEFTLDNSSRAQLITMCKYMNLPPYGTDAFLRFQLRQKLKQLKRDDRLIQKEGIESLTVPELQAALRARGMRGTSNNKNVLRRALREWLDLSLKNNLPSSLLILSRAFVINEKEPSSEALKGAISSMSEEAVEGLQIKINEMEGKVTNEQIMEILQKQSDIIEQEKAEAKIHEEEKLREISEKITVFASASPVEVERKELNELKAEREHRKAEQEKEAREREEKELQLAEEREIEQRREAEAEKIKEAQDALQEPQTTPVEVAEPEKVTMTAEEEKEKEKLEKEQVVTKPEQEKEKEEKEGEREELAKEEEERKRKEEEERKQKEQEEEERKKREEERKREDEKLAQRLQTRLDKMIDQLEKEVEKVESTVGGKLQVIDRDGDGIITTEELAEAINLLKEKLPEEKIQEIVGKLDKDHDGKITVQEIVEYALEEDDDDEEEVDEEQKKIEPITLEAIEQAIQEIKAQVSRTNEPPTEIQAKRISKAKKAIKKIGTRAREFTKEAEEAIAKKESEKPTKQTKAKSTDETKEEEQTKKATKKQKEKEKEKEKEKQGTKQKADQTESKRGRKKEKTTEETQQPDQVEKKEKEKKKNDPSNSSTKEAEMNTKAGGKKESKKNKEEGSTAKNSQSNKQKTEEDKEENN